jgi:hypothetical protein
MKKLIDLAMNYVRREWFLILMMFTIMVVIFAIEVMISL